MLVGDVTEAVQNQGAGAEDLTGPTQTWKEREGKRAKVDDVKEGDIGQQGRTVNALAIISWGFKQVGFRQFNK